MRAIKWLLCFAVIITTGLTAFATEIEHKYGIEFRGARSMYLNMKDPNDYVKGFAWSPGYASNGYDKSVGSFGGGISVLYKSRPWFAWHIGMNVLGKDSASASASSGNLTQNARVFTSAVELFFTANYYWNITPRFNLEFGAGPAFYLASMDREKPAAINSVTQFFGAHGRSFGAVGTANLELFLSKGISLKAGGGFRFAHIARFKYYEENPTLQGSTQIGKIAYWDSPTGLSSYNTFEADFTGLFAEVGFRIYFEPKGDWGHGELRGE
jgi:hypothetical protein